MKVIDFGQAACQRVRQLLDAYVSGELLVETAQEVERHLERCPACAHELAQLESLRRALRQAGRSVSVPPGLDERVRRQLRRRSVWPGRPALWVAAVASLLIAFAAGWIASVRITGHAPHEFIAHQLMIHTWLRGVQGVFRFGLGTHANCAYYRPQWKDELPASEIIRELGHYAPLSTVLQTHIPAKYTLLVAHRCEYMGREYLHFALKNDPELISVILTKKHAGDAFSGAAASGGYEVVNAAQFTAAGFEAEDYLAFVVSNLDEASNLAIAQALRDPLAAEVRRLEPPSSAAMPRTPVGERAPTLALLRSPLRRRPYRGGLPPARGRRES